MLLAAAEAGVRSEMLAGAGLRGATTIDWPALVARKRTFTGPVAERTEGWLHDAGVQTLHGEARAVGSDELEVGGRRLRAAHIVIATGARPMPLAVEGKELIATSDDFLELAKLPPRVAFIGGGYISFEFAWLAHRVGAEVTIVHRSARVLKGFDADLAVHGAGRVPDVDRLGLENAGVAFDRSGVRVDEHLRSVSNPRFWAAAMRPASACR